MRFILIITLFILWAIAPARADVIDIQRLNFGSWYIPNNNAVYDITVNTDGTYSNSPQITKVTAPKKGIYDIGGLPVSSTILSITPTQNTALTSGGSNFQMDNFVVVPSSASTDASGRVTVTVGAQAHTSGNGVSYPNATYNGTIDLQFNF